MGKKKIKKRARAMQSIVGIVCLGMIGFVLVWASYKAFRGFDNSSSNAISAAPISAAEKDDPKKAQDTESKAETSSNTDDAKPDESKPEESVPDVSTPEPSTPDAGSENTYWTESIAGKPVESRSDTPQFPTAAEIDDDFADAVFIGNSRTVGLGMNCGKPQATFYASTGMNVNRIWDAKEIKLDDGTEGTVFDALKQHQFKRVYVMFGINEIGWPYLNVFQEMYEKVVNEIKSIQPDAKIYIQSVLPVSPKAVNTDAVFTTANVDALNDNYIKNVAANTGATYLDVNSALRNSSGDLPDEASADGIHLVKNYCLVWLKYLADHS